MCTLMREGRKCQGIKHGDAYRTRVEQALRDANNRRLDRAERRVLDELERRAAGEEAPLEAADGPAPAAAEADEDRSPNMIDISFV